MDHSETDKRYHIKNEELVIRKETQKEGDGDDIVDTDTDQSELMKEIREKNPDLHKTLDSQKIGHDEYSVATDIDLESNVTRNTDLSTSTLVARQLTVNADDTVDEEK